jgi:purine-binding chemotaxis protein CheW
MIASSAPDTAAPRAVQAHALADSDLEYVTLTIRDQTFGLPIADVHEVFATHQITTVPLAPAAIKGLLNLRGRVVTALCMRTLLGLGDAGAVPECMAIGVEMEGEPFALLVDRVGDVMRLPLATLEPNPIHIDENWQNLSRGVHRLETSILVVVDLGKIIASQSLAS